MWRLAAAAEKKWLRTTPLTLLAAAQPQPGFTHEDRELDGLVWRFMGELLGGQPA